MVPSPSEGEAARSTPSAPDRRLAVIELAAAAALLLFASAFAFSPYRGATTHLGWRALAGAAAVWFLPGYSLLRWRWLSADREDPLQQIAMSVGVGYVLVLLVDIAIVELHLNCAWGWGLLLAWVLAWQIAGARRKAPPAFAGSIRGLFASFRTSSASRVRAAIALAIVAAGLAAQRVGSFARGEEVVEIISARKLLENTTLARDNIMHRPGVTPTYVYTPSYLSLALMARTTGAHLIGLDLSLRGVYTFLAQAALYSAALALFGRLAPAASVSVAGLLLVFLDPDPASFPASLFPLTRRGAVAAGVLLPLAFAFAVGYLKRGGAALGIFATLLVPAILTTHATEAAHLLLFLGAVPVAALVFGRSNQLAARGLLLAAGGLLLTGLYLALQAWLAPHVREYDAARKATLPPAAIFVERPWRALFGETEATTYIFESAAPALPYGALAVVAGPALLLNRAPWAPVLYAALVLPVIALGVPGVYRVLVHFTTLEIWAIYGYLTVTGLLATGGFAEWALRAKSGRRAPVFAAAARLGLFVLPAAWGIVFLLELASWLAAPWLVVTSALAWACRRRAIGPDSSAVAPASFTAGVTILALLPMVLLFRYYPTQLYVTDSSNERSTRPTLFRQEPNPDPARWEENYRSFAGRFNPPSDIPLHVIRAIENRVPPGRVFLYDPAAMYTLPVLVNQYVAHAGFPISTEEEYYRRFYQENTHAVFNRKPFVLWAQEALDLLEAYRVDYLLVNPSFQHLAERIDRLNGSSPRPVFLVVYRQGGFHLYQVDRRAVEGARAGLRSLSRRDGATLP